MFSMPSFQECVGKAATLGLGGSEFIVITGRMPQNKATLFNLKGELVFDFGTSPRNTVAWAPVQARIQAALTDRKRAFL